MTANVLPFQPSENQLSVSSNGINPVGAKYEVGDQEYQLVENDESAGVIKRRALTRKSMENYTVDYTDSTADTIAGFTPDDLVGTVLDGSGILMKFKGEIILGVDTETIADNVSLYWSVATNLATATAGSSGMYIGKNKGAVANADTELTCVLDITPDFYNVVD